MAYSYETIRRVSQAELEANLVGRGGDASESVELIAATAQQELMDKVVYERWCPHTGAGVSSF